MIPKNPPAKGKSVTRAPQKRKGSSTERRFALHWRVAQGPELQCEYLFHPTRKWRFDFAHLPTMTAIELEGGVWSGGRHTRGAGFVADCEKYNAAVYLGWRVIRLAGPMLGTVQVGELARFLRGMETRISAEQCGVSEPRVERRYTDKWGNGLLVAKREPQMEPDKRR